MRNILSILLIICAISIWAQYSPGELPFTYINIAVSPISSALSMSGAAAQSPHRDIFNPASAAFNSDANDLYFSYTSHFASTHLGYFEYNMPSMRIGLKYFNSGSMERRDSLNNYIGDFSDNTLLLTYTYGYRVNEKISVGISALAGIENMADFNQYAGALSAGAIYRFNEMIAMGVYAGNAGIAYSSSMDILPARVIGGVKIGSENTPINLYIDAGKILDSDYFYSAGAQLHVLRSTDNPSVEQGVLEYSKSEGIINMEDTIQYEAMEKDSIILPEDRPDSMETVSNLPALETADSIAAGIEADTLSEEDEESFMSYADYLENQEKDKNEKLEAEDEEGTEAVLEENADAKKQDKEEETDRRESIMDQFGFVLRGGVSSDKQLLQSGTSLDLVAGLSAGFGLSFKNYQVDYAAKFWGELGIGHSIGVKVVF